MRKGKFVGYQESGRGAAGYGKEDCVDGMGADDQRWRKRRRGRGDGFGAWRGGRIWAWLM